MNGSRRWPEKKLTEAKKQLSKIWIFQKLLRFNEIKLIK